MIRIFRHYVPRSLLFVGFAEGAILYFSAYLGVYWGLQGPNPTPKPVLGSLWIKALLYASLMLLLLGAAGLYARGLRDHLRGILLRVGLAALAGLIVMSAVLMLVPVSSVGGRALVTAVIASTAGIMLLRGLTYHFIQRGMFRRRVLVLGAGREAAGLRERLRRKDDWREKRLVGYVPLPEEEVLVDPRAILAVQTSLADLASAHRVHELVVAAGEPSEGFPFNQIRDCKMRGIDVVDLPAFLERETGKVHLEGLNPSAVIFAHGFVHGAIRSHLHRAFDLLASVLLLAVAWPVMVVAAAAIFIDSGARGPVLYPQERVGRNGSCFRMLKLRTMTLGAEGDSGPTWARPEDARTTRVGSLLRKTRIDELPQLINVLKGEMSLVGPRPERPQLVQQLIEQIPFYDLRHRVNPGITGWAQICYPYGASVSDAREKLRYDLYYIKNYSLFLDLMILIQTTQVILWGKGAR